MESKILPEKGLAPGLDTALNKGESRSWSLLGERHPEEQKIGLGHWRFGCKTEGRSWYSAVKEGRNRGAQD